MSKFRFGTPAARRCSGLRRAAASRLELRASGGDKGLRRRLVKSERGKAEA